MYAKILNSQKNCDKINKKFGEVTLIYSQKGPFK